MTTLLNPHNDLPMAPATQHAHPCNINIIQHQLTKSSRRSFYASSIATAFFEKIKTCQRFLIMLLLRGAAGSNTKAPGAQLFPAD
jgi:hypothetical protein